MTGALAGTVAAGLVAAAVARATLAGLEVADRSRRDRRCGRDDRWHRHNHAGAHVTLYAGPAAVAGIAAGIAVTAPRTGRARVACAAVGVLGATAVGWYDDARSVRPAERSTKGFAGHLRALGAGRVSAGLVKLAGTGTAALLAMRFDDASPLDAVLGAGVVAGAAGVVNLLDLRPGRAAKAVIAASVPLVAAGRAGAPLAAVAVGAAAGVAGPDLAGRTMLGDAGAAALGALVGVAAVAGTGRPGRIAWFTPLAALTAASERVSFTAVIERHPVLRRLDALGRPTPTMP